MVSRWYRVHLKSKPGMWEYYKGYVDVLATNPTDAEKKAIKKLATGTFKDRGYGAWELVRMEFIGG